MLEKKNPHIFQLLLLSAILLKATQASPLPLPPAEEDLQVDRTARSFPSNTRKSVSQVEPSESKAVNNTGSVSASEEFTPWHQEQRNISSGDGDLLDVDDSNVGVGNNATLPGSTNSSKSENNTCTLEPAFLCFMDPVHSQRNKELRLNAIKEYVIRSLLGPGPQERPPLRINKDALMNRLSSPFSGQLQTFYASCDSPTNVDLDTWTSPSFFHIYFNVTSSSTSPVAPEPPQQVSQNRSAMVSHEYVPVSTSRNFPFRKTSGQYQQTVNIISAKLRLYKTGHGTQAEIPKYEAPNPSEPCNETDSSSEINPTIFPTSIELPSQGLPTPDERIRVTVYWYTAPLTKNHYKRKLLDTKMMSVKDSKWVDFDIQKAAKAWLDRKINYGLVIEVENEDNDIVDARKYFSNLPCELISGARNNASSQANENETSFQAQSESGSGSESSQSTTQTMEILPPPVVEICTLTVPSAPRNTEYEATSFFPFPFQMNPSGYPVAVTTQKAVTSRPPMNPNDLWPNDDQNTANNNSNQHQNHHHRHNHGRNKNRHQHKKNNSRNQQFKLDDDHPLRQILATAPSSLNSRENRRNTHRSNSNNNSNSSPRVEDQINTEDYVYVDDQNDREEGVGKNREIIIQKIYITPPQINTKSSSNNDERSSENLNR